MGLLTTCMAAWPACAGSFTFVTLDPPGGSQSFAQGINDAGQVVGVAIDRSGINKPFVWQNGAFTTIAPPKGLTFTGSGFVINAAGVAAWGGETSQFKYGIFRFDTTTQRLQFSVLPFKAGIQQNYALAVSNIDGSGTVAADIYSDKHSIGFTQAATGAVTPLHDPSIVLRGGNQSGVVVGSDKSQGLIYKNGSLHGFAVDGNVATPATVNASGLVGGRYNVGSALHDFVFDGAKSTTYDNPADLTNFVVAIGPANEVIGIGGIAPVLDAGPTFWIALGGTYYDIAIAGASRVAYAVPAAVNASGTIVGTYYVGVNKTQHAFVAICPADQFPCTQ